MSESVVADFVAHFRTPDTGTDPVAGRVLLSQKRLVLAADDGKTTVPLSRVFDVSVGAVPDEMDEFFSDTVTVAYTEDGERRIAIVEGTGENVDRFTTVLFKVLLNGVEVRVEHPARVGGRVTDATAERASLRVREREIACVDCSTPVAVDLTAVTDIERERRELAGSKRDLLRIDHLDDGSVVTTLLAVPSRRKGTVLGRYVRRQYGEVVEELADRDHSEEEREALVAIYSTGEGADVRSVLGADPAQVTMTLNSLREDGLVTDDDGVTRLTPKGRIAATNYLESVNSGSTTG